MLLVISYKDLYERPRKLGLSYSIKINKKTSIRMKLTKEQALGLLRHVFTFAGGVLISRGLLEESTLVEISGALITIIGSIWSAVEKKKTV